MNRSTGMAAAMAAAALTLGACSSSAGIANNGSAA